MKKKYLLAHYNNKNRNYYNGHGHGNNIEKTLHTKDNKIGLVGKLEGHLYIIRENIK